MKRQTMPAILSVILLLAALAPHGAFADGEGDSKFKIGVGGGVLFYALLGPRSITSFPVKIKFDKDSFKPGFSGGIEGLFFPSPRHSIAAGAFYEQRRIDLKVVDLTLFGILQPVSLFLPLESLVKTTRISTHYLNLPVTYRFHVMKHFYLGAGLDVAALLKARADYRIVIFDMGLDLKKYFRPADLGARLLAGFTVEGVYGELSAGIGLLDIDSWEGVRRSVYVKGMIGYRFL